MSRPKKSGCLAAIGKLFLALLAFYVFLVVVVNYAELTHTSETFTFLGLGLLCAILLFARHMARRSAKITKADGKGAPEASAAGTNDVPEYDIPPWEPPIVVNTQEELDQFFREHQLAETITTKVVGVAYPNHDGLSRQLLLAKCHDGDPLSIVFYRYRGEPAYFVYAPCGEIGVLNRFLAAEIYEKYGDYSVFYAHIISVTGGDAGRSYGCNISIDVYV